MYSYVQIFTINFSMVLESNKVKLRDCRKGPQAAKSKPCLNKITAVVLEIGSLVFLI